MSFLRTTTMFRASVLRPALSAAPRARMQVRHSTQDYGSGKGNPAGENPKDQGDRGPVSAEMEHPGPSPPKVAQNNKSSSESSVNKSSDSQAKSSSEGAGGKSGNSKKGAQPKILSDNPPDENHESVRQHNEEFAKRPDRANAQVSNKDAEKDKAPAGYWGGKCSHRN
ncbi:hypothetical protein BDV95DRAFT_493130 [Massariosphaeria phaeospora]|uniref:Uncharacterized protein n=1 Tax=Massariosphaeria phaeospora TaxID=100035 RepID=A0A7C8MCF5_9PLEO|nr:hypothetical protein BDV95DRAFT_493130 [Massariosphaeria phaeospora]